MTDAPVIGSADAAATYVAPESAGSAAGGQQSLWPLAPVGFENAAGGPSRPRGRPVGAGGYALEDMRLLPDIQAQLVPAPTVETLRDAVRIVEPRISGFGSPLSRMRRVERLYREIVST